MMLYNKGEMKRVIVGNSLYILLESIDKSAIGRRTRKKALRLLRKEIAKLRDRSPYEYVVLTNMSVSIITDAFKAMYIEKKVVTPYGLLKTLGRVDQKLFGDIGLNYDILKEVESETKSPHLYKSLMFINRLIDEVDKIIENDLEPTKEATKDLLDKLKNKL